MKCPDCKTQLNCGCDACLEHSPDKPNKLLIINVVDGNDWDEQCPVCSKSMSVHDWFDEEAKQYDEMKKNARSSNN